MNTLNELLNIFLSSVLYFVHIDRQRPFGGRDSYRRSSSVNL